MVEAADEHGMMGTRPALEPGQKVVVRPGPLADFVGTLERLDSAGRASGPHDERARRPDGHPGHRRPLSPAPRPDRVGVPFRPRGPRGGAAPQRV